MIDDFSPVYVESYVQTIESGNPVRNSLSQTDVNLSDQLTFHMIYHTESLNEVEESNTVEVQTIITGDI